MYTMVIACDSWCPLCHSPAYPENNYFFQIYWPIVAHQFPENALQICILHAWFHVPKLWTLISTIATIGYIIGDCSAKFHSVTRLNLRYTSCDKFSPVGWRLWGLHMMPPSENILSAEADQPS